MSRRAPLQQAMLLRTFVDKGLVRRVKEYTTDESAEFVLVLTPKGVQHFKDIDKSGTGEELIKALKLQRNLLTTNMHLFDHQGEIKKFESVHDVISDFMPIRLALCVAV